MKTFIITLQLQAEEATEHVDEIDMKIIIDQMKEEFFEDFTFDYSLRVLEGGF